MQKGFFPIWLIVVIAVAVVGGGAAVYKTKRVAAPSPIPVIPIESIAPAPTQTMEGFKGVIEGTPNAFRPPVLAETSESLPSISVFATPKPTPKSTVQPTAPAATATPTPIATPTPTPVATPTPAPSATPTPIPTSTPTPTPSTSSGPSATPTPSATPVATASVVFRNYDLVFAPSDLTVLSGTAVTFKNESLSQTIWVASNPHPQHGDLPEFSSGALQPGQSYTFLFNTVGNWEYHNHLNPGVGGKVRVVASF